MNQLEIAVKKINFDGQLLQDINLAKYTTWHVGGKADFVYKPSNLKDLSNFLAQLNKVNPEITINWLGLGSNVLIRDGGLRGLLILTNGSKDDGLNQLELVSDNTLKVGAGVTCAKLAKFLADQNCPAGAFWAGIPGTMGGALAMNAGCYGHETWQYVKKVSIINRLGEIADLNSEEFIIKYRSIKYSGSKNLQEFWFVSALLSVPKDETLNGRQAIKDLLQTRTTSQPIGQFSGGSVFKNPQGDHAARLIEAAGLKGYSIGGARVSEKHANFMINDKTARSSDIEQLIYYVQKTVLEKFSISLEPEVRIMGEAGEANE